ncbi:ATP-binding protein [Verrucomicrobiota bacterium]
MSYPGPDRSVHLDELRAGRALPRRYRNRRIGEFLKELDITEGRATGIPKILNAMQENGSPPPVFDLGDSGSALKNQK